MDAVIQFISSYYFCHSDCESQRDPENILNSASNWCLIVSRRYFNDLLMFLLNLTGEED